MRSKGKMQKEMAEVKTVWIEILGEITKQNSLLKKKKT